MRILAMHDTQGNIHEIAVSPADSPTAAVTVEPGLLVTEVEAPEFSGLDLRDPETQQQLAEVLEQFRVEAKAEARLVRKEPDPY